MELCNEFMNALAYTGLKRRAMYPVYGLAEASLAVALPSPGSDYRWIRVNRHNLGVGTRIELNPADVRDVIELMCVGPRVPNTELIIVENERTALPEGIVGHILIRGPSITHGYFGDLKATAEAIGADGWVDTGDLGVLHEGALYITGRSKEIIFVNGQNYYPYDLENIAQRVPGLDLNKVVATNIAGIDSQSEEIGVFVLHRGSMQEFLATAAAVGRLINEHTGLEVAQVIPTKRIPKTTSGKVQRHLLVRAFIDGEFDTELAELGALRAARDGMEQRSCSDLESQLQLICETVLPGKRIDIDDNLFEIGASSLRLIEIHENINRDFSGLIDLTELFEHPTIGKLARHLQSKLERTAA